MYMYLDIDIISHKIINIKIKNKMFLYGVLTNSYHINEDDNDKQFDIATFYICWPQNTIS